MPSTGCLHPDQVKVWFMLQRLHYGISWDYKDICDIRRKVTQSQGKGTMQKRMREEIKEDIREMKLKREEAAVKIFEPPDEMLEMNPVVFSQPQNQAFNIDSHLPTSSDNHSMETEETEARVEEEPHLDAKHDVVFTDVSKLKELIKMNNYVAESSPIFPPHQVSYVGDQCPLTTQTSCNTKTQNQLMMMRFGFLSLPVSRQQGLRPTGNGNCIPRYVLVHWFGDMRSYVKKARPRWMTKERHSQVQANIKYQQGLNALQKIQPTENTGNTT
ncbi:hypothetical protein Q5P01_002560 [Channa striata]|uniref:Uncharacterized protein n=1 Tax=Channa striata TaxID=64152 RepID=A0AA88T4X8_CHASR|nr:hypothetical protein Q5P01_002560 [Channa striata]